MIFSSITFRKLGLQDDPAKKNSQFGDDVAGFNCANWVISWLGGFGATEFDEEPIEEDWGYAIRVRVGADVLLIGCGSASPDDPDRWRITVGDNFVRGVFPWTRRRRLGAAEKLSAFVERTLSSAQAVTEVRVDQIG